MSEVEWRDVPGYEGLYQVSNTGKVRSLHRWHGTEYIKRPEPYVLAQSNTTTGYKKVELVRDAKKKSLKVHRLVAMAFIPNPENKPNINHKDGNPINNSVENLEWCTQKENIRHAYATGLIPLATISKEELKSYVDSGMTKKEITKKVHITYERLGTFYKKYKISTLNDKYHIDKKEFVRLVKAGFTNTELADKYGCSNSLIARMKYKMKKGDYGE